MGSLVVGDNQTLTTGHVSDDILCNITRVYNSPEILKNQNRTSIIQLPDGSASDYLSIGLAGYRIVTVLAQVPNNKKNSPILTDIKGIKSYILSDGESYFIQSVSMELVSGSRIATIALVNNQDPVTNPNNPIYPSDDISFEITPIDSHVIYLLNDIVEGSTIDISGIGTSISSIKFQIYRYGDDDIFLNSLLGYCNILNFKIKQGYIKNSVTETETYSGNNFKLSVAKNVFGINDIGITTDSVLYEIYTETDLITRELTK